MKRCFEILGVGEDATLEQMQAAYEEATAGMLGELQVDAAYKGSVLLFWIGIVVAVIVVGSIL